MLRLRNGVGRCPPWLRFAHLLGRWPSRWPPLGGAANQDAGQPHRGGAPRRARHGVLGPVTHGVRGQGVSHGRQDLCRAGEGPDRAEARDGRKPRRNRYRRGAPSGGVHHRAHQVGRGAGTAAGGPDPGRPDDCRTGRALSGRACRGQQQAGDGARCPQCSLPAHPARARPAAAGGGGTPPSREPATGDWPAAPRRRTSRSRPTLYAAGATAESVAHWGRRRCGYSCAGRERRARGNHLEDAVASGFGAGGDPGAHGPHGRRGAGSAAVRESRVQAPVRRPQPHVIEVGAGAGRRRPRGHVAREVSFTR